MSADPVVPAEPVALVLEPRERNLGDGFFVRRVLPSGKRRAVGPFVFFDHFGPTTLLPGHGLDVRPHPHINLATVTYLYEGEIDHRDSLGSFQTIRAGDINWMTAGRGIVHSERTPPALRARGSRVHGLQLWVGLPREHEEAPPAFHHYAGETLPVVRDGGAVVRVLAGEAFGARSPVATFSRLVYLDCKLDEGAAIDLPEALGARGVYMIDGKVSCGGASYGPARMLVLAPQGAVRVAASSAARFVVVGGDAFPEPRHLWWNFASSSEARIDQAKRDWLERRGEPSGPFPLVPGDEHEFIPIAE
jgi:redox-sensitive bicupin YhaK (pirin superfamily)